MEPTIYFPIPKRMVNKRVYLFIECRSAKDAEEVEEFASITTGNRATTMIGEKNQPKHPENTAVFNLFSDEENIFRAITFISETLEAEYIGVSEVYQGDTVVAYKLLLRSWSGKLNRKQKAHHATIVKAWYARRPGGDGSSMR